MTLAQDYYERKSRLINEKDPTFVFYENLDTGAVAVSSEGEK